MIRRTSTGYIVTVSDGRSFWHYEPIPLGAMVCNYGTDETPAERPPVAGAVKSCEQTNRWLSANEYWRWLHGLPKKDGAQGKTGYVRAEPETDQMGRAAVVGVLILVTLITFFG